MPHGGGHVGGGHHGGGGHHHGGGGHHHGGGFRHHHGGGFRHHHHHHHHYGYGGGWVWSGPYYGRRYHPRGFVWCGVVFAVIIVVAVILSISLSVGYATNNSEENRYTSGDTRLNSLDTFFCEGARVSSSDYAENTPISVYLLSKEPPLTDRNSFTIQNTVNIEEDAYEYWHFYLHPGSNITMTACATSHSYYFYIIEGSSNFNRWKDNPSTSYARTSLYVSTVCSQGNQTRSYKVSNGGHYYLPYYTSSSEAKGQQSLYIERYEYSTDDISSRQSCQVSASSSSCSVNTDMSSRYNKVLIKVPFNPDSDFNSPYTVNYKCLSRAGAYAIVTVIPLAVIISCGVILLVAIFCFLRSKSKNYETLASPETSPSPNPSFQ